MTDHPYTCDRDKLLCPARENLLVEVEQLRAALQEMPDIIKDFDGGNPETSTGWASEEMLDLWMRVTEALEKKS